MPQASRAELNKADFYECQAWTKDQLGRIYTIVEMAPDRSSNIPFLSFIACPRFNEASDPRVQADRIPFETSSCRPNRSLFFLMVQSIS